MKFTLTNNEPFQINGSINDNFKSVNILDLHTSEIINDSSYVSVFPVTITENNNEYSVDKTFVEITTAYNENKIIEGRLGDSLFSLGYIDSSILKLQAVYPEAAFLHTVYVTAEDNVYAYVKQIQEVLVSGTNIKTVNNTSLLGSGNISVVSLEYLAQNYVRKPVVLYETDGTTGLLGLNNNTINTSSWQLENMDFTPYKYLRCYFKVSDYSVSSNYLTPALIIEVLLDEASKSKAVNDTVPSGKVPCDLYIGGAGGTNPNDRNVSFNILVAVDSTKTKFQVISEHSIYGTALGGRNDSGRYCYKIEGCYD